MFIAVYRFKVRAGHESAFIQAWKVRTEAIYLRLGSLGSRLHLEASTGDYIGYAQWPSRDHWHNADFSRLNCEVEGKYAEAGKIMQASTISSDTILELEVTADYLQHLPFVFD